MISEDPPHPQRYRQAVEKFTGLHQEAVTQFYTQELALALETTAHVLLPKGIKDIPFAPNASINLERRAVILTGRSDPLSVDILSTFVNAQPDAQRLSQMYGIGLYDAMSDHQRYCQAGVDAVRQCCLKVIHEQLSDTRAIDERF